MRIAIATRIFAPEPSAATFRLGALVGALVQRGDHVTVLTVRPPAPLRSAAAGAVTGVRVRRWPVLRDNTGYVRGYVPYMSFDVPLFFRLLLGRRYGLIVVEPPPTTGFFVRLAATLRRTPYAYYAADIWSDAAQQTGAPGWMVRVVRGLERFSLRGARTVLSVSPGVTRRLAELGVAGNVATIGNGIDAHAFSTGADPDGGTTSPEDPVFVYAGTASEWHGASIFVEALPAVLQQVPSARLRFIGGGSELEALERRAHELGVAHAVTFDPVLAPADLAPILRSATAAIASVRPGAGYDFAFPTKLYSAAVCGAPLIYSGSGPAVEFVGRVVDGEPIGVAVGDDAGLVAAAMIDHARSPRSEGRRRQVADWARGTVSLDGVASQAAATLHDHEAPR